MKKMIISFLAVISVSGFAAESRTMCETQFNNLQASFKVEKNTLTLSSKDTSAGISGTSTYSILSSENINKLTTIFHVQDSMDSESELLLISSINETRSELTIIDPTDPSPALTYSSAFCD